MFTLDTNILIYYFAGDQLVTDFLAKQLEREISFFIPTIVIVEFLAYPALDTQSRKLFIDFLNKLEIIDLNYDISLKAGDLRREHKIKLGDSVVAATVLKTNCTLLTRNIQDFQKVPNLKVQLI